MVDIETVLGFGSGAAAGTGVVMTSSGEVLTNNHVINGATSIKVTIVATGRSYTATVLGTDPTDDVALLQLFRRLGSHHGLVRRFVDGEGGRLDRRDG